MSSLTLLSHARAGLAWRSAALALAVFSATGAQAQWNQDGYGPGKTFANSAETTLGRHNVGQLVIRWQARVGQFYASPITQTGGRLFACSNLNGASAQSPTDGTFLWTQWEAGVGQCGTPALAGTQSFVVSSDFQSPYRNVVSALDQATGAVQWELELPSDATSLGLNYGPVVQNTRLYASAHRVDVWGVNLVDGSLAWQAATSGVGVQNNDPAVAGGRVFISTWHECCGNVPRQLFAFDARDGKPLWVQDVDLSNMQYPALAMGQGVFVGSDSGLVSAFNASSGKLAWSRQLTGYVSSHLVGQGQSLFVASGNTRVQALDAATGEVRWSRVLPHQQSIESNMAWANGLLYMVTQDPASAYRLVALNAKNGKTVAALPIAISGYSKLTVIDGQVYLSTNGMLTMLSL